MNRMGLEHKSRPLLPLPRFLMRVLRYFLVSLALIIVSLAIGTVGYHAYGNLPWIDSFYNASMILTGMGPVNPMDSTAAKLFSSFYALFSGIAFLSITAVLLAPIAHRLMHILHLGDYDPPAE
jgi:hypothetical protein